MLVENHKPFEILRQNFKAYGNEVMSEGSGALCLKMAAPIFTITSEVADGPL